LIDCGDGQPGYVPLLIQSLRSIHPEAYISDILISHCHKDHWGGLDQIMSSELNQQQTQSINVHKFPLLVEYTFFKHLETFPQDVEVLDLHDNQMFEVDENVHIRVIHTPGHAKDHCAFYLEEEDTVFTADCILGHGSVAFEDLTEYIGGLRRIQEIQPSKLFPGHGDLVNNGIEKVEQYLSMRMAKENQILDIMKRDAHKTWTPIELVDEMNSVSKGYSETLMAVVVRTVGLHLIKLYHDGKAELVNTQYTQGDPYDTNNVFSMVNQKWRYIGNSSSKL
jgi:ribonuclease/clavin/mitogillin